MNLPTEITICGFVWHIIEDSDSLKDTDAYGETRYTKDEIAIDVRGRSEQRIRQTVMHEMLHAISSMLLGPDDRLQERQVKALATGLFDTFAHNPEVIDYIAGREYNASSK